MGRGKLRGSALVGKYGTWGLFFFFLLVVVYSSSISQIRMLGETKSAKTTTTTTTTTGDLSGCNLFLSAAIVTPSVGRSVGRSISTKKEYKQERKNVHSLIDPVALIETPKIWLRAPNRIERNSNTTLPQNAHILRPTTASREFGPPTHALDRTRMGQGMGRRRSRPFRILVG